MASVLAATLAHAGTTPQISVFNGADPNTSPELTDGQAAAVDFGSTVPGGMVTRDFAVRNAPTAQSTLWIYGLSLPAGFTRMDTRAFPFSLATGETYVFEILFSPSGGGTFSGQMSIENNDGFRNPFNFPITGSSCATLITVNNTNDAGAGSLRQAILDICPGGTINFAAALSNATIFLSTTDDSSVGPSALSISKAIIIQGNGVTVSRDPAVAKLRLFWIGSSGNLTLRDLTLRGGVAQGGRGGGPDSNNSEGGGGGAAGFGGAIYNRGILSVERSTLVANTAQGGAGGGGSGAVSTRGGGGGGLNGDGQEGASGGAGGSGGGGGGGVSGGNGVAGDYGGGGGGGSFGVLNGATRAGANGGFGGGGGGNAGLSGSPHSLGGFGGGDGGQNGPSFGGAGGGGGGGLGGAIFNHNGTVTLVNSTLSGNLAQGGVGGPAGGTGNGGSGGSGLGGAVFNLNGSVILHNSTLANNTSRGGTGGTGAAGGTTGAGAGGAFYNLAHEAVTGVIAANASLALTNSILADSTAAADLVNNRRASSATVTATAPNIIESSIVNSGGTVNGSGVINQDPQLGPLQNNGGPTFTQAPSLGSPALDVGMNANASSTDQRGFPRIINGTVDIGAVETQPIAPVLNCPGDIVVANDPGQCSALVSFSVTATGYPPPAVTCTLGATAIASPYRFSVGTNLVTCTATNIGGTNICNFRVIVKDTQFPVSCATPPAGMISWWPGDGNLSDIQDGNPLTSVFQPGSFAPGMVGQAFVFTGAQALSAGTPANLRLTGTAVTLDGWINPSSSFDGVYFGRSQSGVNDYTMYFLGGNLAGSIRTTTSGETFVHTGVIPPLNTWTHVAMTYDGVEIRIYTNGVVATTQPKTGNIANGSAPFVIGGRLANDLQFRGMIDEVEVFSRALSAAEIRGLFLAGSFGKCRPRIVSTDPGQCFATVTAPLFIENCPGATAACSPSTVPKGTGPVTCVITDASGNGITNSFTVIVRDTEPPSLVCPANMTVGNSPGLCAGTATYAPAASDNCPGLVVSCIPPSGSLFNVGPASTVVCMATDQSGNSTNCSFTVTVRDTEPPRSCVTPPVGMIAWWPGDANPADVQGGHNGTLMNGAGFGPGKVAQSFQLDGSDQFVEVADSPAWDFGAGAFTIDLWVNFDAVRSANAFLAHDEGSGSQNKWIFWLVNNRLILHLNSPTLGAVDVGSVPFNPVANQWYHLAVTRSGNSYTFYINGAPTPATDANSIPDASAPLTIGQAEGGSFLDGRLDEIEIFNRALSPAEIQSIIGAGAFGKCKPVTTNTAPGTCGQIVSYGAPAFSDNCSGGEIVCSPASQSTFPKGITPVVCVATDAAGNAFTNSFAVTVLDLEPPRSCVTPPSGMISWWPGDGSAADIQDGNPGTFLGATAPGHYAEGMVGQAFDFDGDNDVVSIPNSPSLTISGDQVTIDGWIYPLANTKAEYFGKVRSGLNPYFLIFDDNNVRGLIRAGGNNVNLSTGYVPPLNAWTHLALTYDGTNMTVYANGAVVGVTAAQGNIDDDNATFSIGGVVGDSFFFRGRIDEVEVFNRALTPAEVRGIYNAGTFGKCKPVVVAASPGQCTGEATFPDFADNCPGATASCSPASGSAFAVGTTPVTCVITDSSGNSITNSFQVVVKDTEPPTITCGANRSVECGVAWDFGDATATDNCAVSLATRIVSTTTNALCGKTYAATRVFDATDASGNVATCSQTVTVVDTTAPVITCAPARSVECGTPWNFDPPSATDGCNGSDVLIRVVGTVTNQTCGRTFSATRTWQATDPCTNSAQCSQTITVVDTTPPVLANCPANVVVECDQVPAEAAVTASDACDPNPAVSYNFMRINGSCPNNYSLVRVWTVADACGNTNICSQTITVVDTTRPSLSCADVLTNTASMTCSQVVSYRITATDVCGNVTVTCAPTNRSVFVKGTNTVNCTADDGCGNTNSCSFKVVVRDTEAPTITCPASFVAVADPGQCSRNNVTFNPSATDNCDGMVAIVCAPASGGTFPVGSTTVRCLATDDDGNTNSCSFVVTVRDAEAPAASCPIDRFVMAAPGATSAVVNFTLAGATDNCGVKSTNCSPPSGASFLLGDTTVNCTVSDAAANTSSPCSFLITVCSPLVTVLNTNDSGVGCLRWAIANVCTNGTVNFHSSLSGQTIGLTTGDLAVNKDVSIVGLGVTRLAISGNGASRIFNISADSVVNISGLTIRDGRAEDGGAIEFNGAHLRVVACLFTNNHATVVHGGAISATGNPIVDLTECQFSGNSAASNGGAFDSPGVSLNVSNCAFHANSAENGGAMSIGAGAVTIANTTFSGNSADRDGGAINSAFSAQFNVLSCTIVSNQCGRMGGGVETLAAFNVVNTIVAHNTAPTGPNISGVISSGGHNLIGDPSGASGFDSTDLQNASAMVGPLANNGGPTFTHALLTNSPAINAGTNPPAAGLAYDQRGSPFARIVGPAVDIGAFEVQDNGPVCLLAWKFDELSGLTALDSSGNTNLGRLINGPTRTSGVVGRAIRFDGSDDRVSATNANSLNVTGAFTVACWVKPESISDSSYILIKGDSSDKKYAYGLRNSNGKLQYRWISPGGSESVFQSSSVVLTNGRWTHVACAHLPGSLPMLFINAVSVPGTLSSGSATALVGTSSNPFSVGAASGAHDEFKGTIDEVFVCLSKLTAGQIQNLTNGLPPGPPPPPPVPGIVTSSPLPDGRAGAAYSQSLMATGGTPGYTWSLVSGTLPPGLTLNTNSGLISGTPTTATTRAFRARVRDSASQTGEKDFNLTITNPPPPIITTASPLPGGTVSNSYSASLMATGGLAPLTWSLASGTLPSGLVLNTNTGTISGTPTAPGTNSFRVRVRDAAAQTGEKDFTLAITTRPACLVYYKFDEASGPSALDSSGSGNHGILVNGPVHTNGQIGLALRFDGSNDRVNGGSASSLNHTGAITLAAWIRPETVSGNRIVMIKGSISDSANYTWVLRGSDSKLQYRWVNPSGNENKYESAANVLAVGRWTHVAAVHKPGTAPKLYTNGVLIAGTLTSGSASAGIGITSNPFTVGASSDDSQRFQGTIDEVFVCSTALTPADLANLMVGQPPASPSPAPLSLPGIPIDANAITLRVNDGLAILSWLSTPGAVYRVQYKDNLDGDDWSDLSDDTVAGDGTSSAQDFVGDKVQRFYRVLLKP
ncbi:MAG: large repetitive protein [Verrucomicrobiota bacterium]